MSYKEQPSNLSKMCSGWFIDHAAVRWWLLSCCSSDMSGASNTLAREFLTDVHQLCSAVAQRAEARDEDEEESHMVALGEYLVRGRGFLLLSTLDSIIDQVWEPILEVSFGCFDTQVIYSPSFHNQRICSEPLRPPVMEMSSTESTCFFDHWTSSFCFR